MEWEAAAQELNAAIDEKYKNDPKMKKRMKAALKRKINDGLAGR
jgi:hypothetical protein